MVNIAIFDFNDERRSQVEAMLQNCLAAQCSPTVRVMSFFSQEALLAASNRLKFDLYILDIGDPLPTGLRLARELRNRSNHSYIIFLAQTPEHALAAFDVRAYHYFLRPVDDYRFCCTVEEILQHQAAIQKQITTVKTRDTVERVHMDDIIYAELVGRTVHYHLVDGRQLETPTMRVNFAEAVSPLLAQSFFTLCGASYAVNLHHIQSVSKEGILFRDDILCTPPKKAIPHLRNEWLHYWQADKPEQSS